MAALRVNPAASSHERGPCIESIRKYSSWIQYEFVPECVSLNASNSSPASRVLTGSSWSVKREVALLYPGASDQQMRCLERIGFAVILRLDLDE
ncbi:hypothetical protein PM082_012825 [Marasmius tenuissimus]|nr:hypothetical protein PM082_012825 [Marasmius tenuissimus]